MKRISKAQEQREYFALLNKRMTEGEGVEKGINLGGSIEVGRLEVGSLKLQEEALLKELILVAPSGRGYRQVSLTDWRWRWIERDLEGNVILNITTEWLSDKRAATIDIAFMVESAIGSVLCHEDYRELAAEIKSGDVWIIR